MPADLENSSDEPVAVIVGLLDEHSVTVNHNDGLLHCRCGWTWEAPAEAYQPTYGVSNPSRHDGAPPLAAVEAGKAHTEHRASIIAARVRAEAVAELCEALGEPLETPGDHPSEPPYRMTWGRALDVTRGRTAVWADLLQRAQVADADWLREYRTRSASRASLGDRIAEAVADERQRIINELAEAARVAHAADGETDADRLLEAARRIGSGYPVRGADSTEAVARLLRFVARFISAAGSVPVATPEVHDAGCELVYGHERCACQRRADVDFSHSAPGPVATPTRCEAKHPRYGQCQLVAGHAVDHVADRGAAGDDDPGYPWGDLAADVMDTVDQALDGEPLVLAVQPAPWFRETPESLAMLDDVRAEVAAVEAAAEQSEER